MHKSVRVIGFDPSLRNWGIAVGELSLDSPSKPNILEVGLIRPSLPIGKQVRQNSLDLESARQLCSGAIEAAKNAHAIFVEVPVGSQSARAMASYGVCVGVLGALRAMGIPFFEVTPKEVKLAGAGSATATKMEMITWAINEHPDVNWPTYVQKGKVLINTASAEHQADAVAAIHAGIAGNSFQQFLSLMRQKS